MYKQQQLIDLLSGRRILIAGYGREGRSSHSLLQRFVPFADVTIASNDEEIFACLEKAERDNTPFDFILKSPGIPSMKFEGRCNLDTITSQTDIFLQLFGSQTIAVTGTKGKSTTTTLIWHILNNAFGNSRHVLLAGNMGIPLFDILPDIDSDTLIVAEFSCHQLENIHVGPHIGIILNLYQEHLDHYHNYLDYQMAKMQMMLCQQKNDHCFYCTDSQELDNLANKLRPNVVSTLHPYSLSDAKNSIVARMETSLRGDHNLSNIYAVWQATSLVGINEEVFAQGLATFKGLPHRLECVGTVAGVTFYNDSISTIPEATIAAVEAIGNVNTLILGGFDRGIDYSPLGSYLANPDKAGAKIRNIVYVGKAGRRMFSEWSINPVLSAKNSLIEDDYNIIVPWCLHNTQQGSVCLLSPAAASYDAFTNFEHRGNTYKQLIHSLS